jgi:hypothetical protein
MKDNQSQKDRREMLSALAFAEVARENLEEAFDETMFSDLDDRELEELFDEAQDALEDLLRGLRSKLRC